ncbi:MAG: HAD-IA family hydrolase [Candidatus Aenigmarchaeota archaeon]|nr:HAD-IA family hydrolase [Candidatus Aenigmarchaeota archaeon]
MIKLFIFDMDGTLIDSVNQWADLFERTFEKYQISVPRDHLLSIFGRGAPEIMRMTVPNGKARPATEFFLHHQKEHIESFRPFPDAEKTLAEIKEKGYKIAIATGNNRHLMRYFLEKFGLLKYVDACVCSQDVKNGKPSPDMLNKVLSQLGICPDEAIYIADSPMDFEAARKAHIRIGIITTGVLCEKKARELKPDYLLKNLCELEKLTK